MSAIKFQAFHDYVLVDPDPTEKKTKGGLIIPDNASKRKATAGRVVAVGPGAPDKGGTIRPMQSKVGDRVAFFEFAGSEVTIGEKNYQIVKESDIYGLHVA